ncbi:MAG: hypothetical protein J3K34DRAFT_439957 [Monoraphidium minutum]|nr:MAG: hypothetical protein J3K34DRAFT_439957 [Monoraphidium minutum]
MDLVKASSTGAGRRRLSKGLAAVTRSTVCWRRALPTPFIWLHPCCSSPPGCRLTSPDSRRLVWRRRAARGQGTRTRRMRRQAGPFPRSPNPRTPTSNRRPVVTTCVALLGCAETLGVRAKGQNPPRGREGRGWPAALRHRQRPLPPAASLGAA